MAKSNSSTDQEWRRNADTHKMSPDEVRSAGVESSRRPPPGQKPGEVLHQRRRLPYSPLSMAIGGFIVVAALGYATLYYKSRPGTSPADVATATVTPDAAPRGGDLDKGRQN